MENKKIIRPDYEHTELEKIAIKSVQIYYEIVDEIENGLAPNLKLAQSTIFVLEELITEMAENETVLLETLPSCKMKPYQRELGNYLHRSFEPLFEFTSDKKEHISLKIKEIITIVKLFDFYVHHISKKYEYEPSKFTTEFIKDLAAWYRDEKGGKAKRSSIYKYLKTNSLGINLFEENATEKDFKKEILFRKEVFVRFFENNDVNNFPDKFSNLKEIIIDFQSYIQQVLSDQ